VPNVAEASAAARLAEDLEIAFRRSAGRGSIAIKPFRLYEI